MDYKVLETLDKDLDSLKKSIYEQNSLRLGEKDMIVLKAINQKINDIVGLVNYLVRNQYELCTKTS